MKKLIFLVAFLCLHMLCQSQSKARLQDGLYLVATVVTDSTKTDQTGDGKALIRFNKLFLESAPEGARGLVVYTADFVPLELDEAPHLLPDTDKKKKLELSFSRLAAEKLGTFTSGNIMKQATLVVNGEALTLNKIRAAITGGKMQITRCGDNACEQIYVQLKKDVKK